MRRVFSVKSRSKSSRTGGLSHTIPATSPLALNEIIWKAIRGRDAVTPPPVQAPFVRPLADDDQEDK